VMEPVESSGMVRVVETVGTAETAGGVRWVRPILRPEGGGPYRRGSEREEKRLKRGSDELDEVEAGRGRARRLEVDEYAGSLYRSRTVSGRSQ
jgi:hypothetical protein